MQVVKDTTGTIVAFLKQRIQDRLLWKYNVARPEVQDRSAATLQHPPIDFVHASDNFIKALPWASMPTVVARSLACAV